MRITEELRYSFDMIMRHKLRFAINCIVVVVLMLTIFTLTSIITTLNKSVDNDIIEYVKTNNYSLSLNLMAIKWDDDTHTVKLSEKKLVDDFLSKYGTVTSDFRVSVNTVDYAVGGINMQLRPTIIDTNTSLNVIKGEPFNESFSAQNYVWVKDTLIEQLNQSGKKIDIGSEIVVTHKGQKHSFILKGIHNGKDSIYVGQTILLEKNIATIGYIKYLVTSENFSNIKSIKMLISDIAKLENELFKPKDNEHITRVNCSPLKTYQISREGIEFYTPIIIVAILFFVILMIGILKNNAMININDNIKFYAMMRCLGLDNNKILNISFFEAILTILIGALIAFALTFALSGLVIFVAGGIISDTLLIVGGKIVFEHLWWTAICFIIGIGLLLYGYFFIVLKRRLKRANLIKVLKEE